MKKNIKLVFGIVFLAGLFFAVEILTWSQLFSEKNTYYPGQEIKISNEVELSSTEAPTKELSVKHELFDQTGQLVFLEVKELTPSFGLTNPLFFTLPADIFPGKYFVQSQLFWGGKSISVIKKELRVGNVNLNFLDKVLGFGLVAIIGYTITVAIFVLLLAFFVCKLVNNCQLKRREVIFDYSDVADDKRYYYEIISGLIGDQKQKNGKKAIKIARSVSGLVIREDGKVLELKKDPSEIVSLLIVKFEKMNKQEIDLNNVKRKNKGIIVRASQNLKKKKDLIEKYF